MVLYQGLQKRGDPGVSAPGAAWALLNERLSNAEAKELIGAGRSDLALSAVMPGAKATSVHNAGFNGSTIGLVLKAIRRQVGEVDTTPCDPFTALVATLTNAKAEVAPYPGSTRVPLPGMMMYEDVGFQLLDLPPITADYNEHWLFDSMRRADLVWLVLSARNPLSGLELVMEKLTEKRLHLHPAFTEPPEDLDWAWVPQPTLLVITGADLADAKENVEIMRELVEVPFPVHLCSPTADIGMAGLRELTFRAAGIIRVYTKQPGKPPDLAKPFTVPLGTTVEDLAYRIHKDLAAKLASARLWGSSAFDGQTVNRSHELQDKDILEIRI